MKKSFVLKWILLSFLCFGCNQGGIVDDDNKMTAYQQELQEQGWSFEQLSDDDMPETYGIDPIRGILDNYFDIELGEGCEMVLKIVDVETNKSIRYVFVNENSTTTITEIPAGKYYLKMAFGRGWMVHHEGETLIGKFTDHVSYEKSDEIFDFGEKNSLEAVSYYLKIHVEKNSRYENFATTEITEEEFFKE